MMQPKQNRPTPRLPLVTKHLHPGLRLGVAVSGGADSVALLRLLAARWQDLGLVLTVLHVHHGIRGAEADGDAAFVASLAARLGLRFLRHDVATAARAEVEHETLEEAARKLRYSWFDELLAKHQVDAVATAHTLDDQAETVLSKLLRGAWTEGLAGIYPAVERPGGAILRPLLATCRADIESWLRQIGQPWREDSTNRDEAYTRNRIRHHLLPILNKYNPQAASHLAHLATIARDEDAYWQGELARILPSLLLPGKPVRGGGRASSTHPDEASIGIELERLRSLSLAMQRRVLRAAAKNLSSPLNFDQTELLLGLCEGKAGHREGVTASLRAERTPRELRLIREVQRDQKTEPPEYQMPIPGELNAEAFALRLTATVSHLESSGHPARLRVHKPGDRVQLRYSSGAKRIKEVLERMRVPSSQRKHWPVLEWKGEIVWMRGADLASSAGEAAGLKIDVTE